MSDSPAIPARSGCATAMALVALVLVSASQAQEGIGTDFLSAVGLGPETDATADEGDTSLPGPESEGQPSLLPGPDTATTAPDTEPAIDTLLPVPSETTEQVPVPETDETAPQSDPPKETRRDPRQVLIELWREDVLGGRTTLGFENWLSDALSPAEDAGEPEAAAPSVTQAEQTRTVAQKWAERTGPVTLGDAGRVVTTYGEAIPTAHCSPLTVCYIELEPGERLTDTPSWGDTARWQVVAKIQGEDPETVVLEIKPADDAKDSNLVIPTDRRLYTIALVNDPDVHTPILAFRWPDTEAKALAQQVARSAERKQAEVQAREAERQAESAQKAERLERVGVPTASGPAVAEILDFRFRMDGQAPFRPVRVFADSEHTYIDLHPSYRGPLPAIVPGPGEGNDALNTRVTRDGTRLVADRHITDIWLQSGRKRVRIRKDNR